MVVKIVRPGTGTLESATKISKDELDRLERVLDHTQGTMEVSLVVFSRAEQERFETAKKGRKWAKYVEVLLLNKIPRRV